MKRFLMAVCAFWGLSGVAQADTLQRIKDTGRVTLGVHENLGVMSYALGDGRYTGFQVEVCQRVLQTIRQRLDLDKLDIHFHVVTASNRIPLVQNGTVDMECGSTTNNLARQRDVAFSLTTVVEEVRMAVRANSGIRSIAQLAGKHVVTTVGSTSVQIIRGQQRERGLGFNETLCKDHAGCFALLASGRADAFVMDEAILAGLIAMAEKPADFRIVGNALALEPIAIVLPKGDGAFKAAVDEAIRAMMRSGDMAQLWTKWFEQPVPPANARVGMPVNQSTRLAWTHPNDRPREAYSLR